eukprot:scaffold1282_cov251-Pinguiococcus_pyrenoidosus.AAC.24
MDTRCPVIHHVGVEALRREGQGLERLEHADPTNESVGRCHRRNDVLHDAHCGHVRHALDAKCGGALQRLLVDPPHVIWGILVQLVLWPLPWPLHDVRVRDAVLGLARCFCDGAQGEVPLRREGVDAAFEAACQAWKDDTSLPREALGATVDERHNAVRIGIAIFVKLPGPEVEKEERAREHL